MEGILKELCNLPIRSSILTLEELISTKELFTGKDGKIWRNSTEYLIQNKVIIAYEKTPEGFLPIENPQEALERIEDETLYFSRERLFAAINEKRIEHLDEVIEDLTPPFVFRKTGRGWEIVWEGKKIAPLTKEGFAIYHELFLNPDKEYSGSDLLSLKRPIPDTPESIDIEHEYKGETIPGELIVKREAGIPIHEGLSEEKHVELLQGYDEVLSNEGLDPEKRMQFNQERRNVCLSLKALKSGNLVKTPKFEDGSTDATGVIAKRLDRALKELNEHDNKEAWEHFRLSVNPLKPKNGKWQYKPVTPIKWKLQ